MSDCTSNVRRLFRRGGACAPDGNFYFYSTGSWSKSKERATEERCESTSQIPRFRALINVNDSALLANVANANSPIRLVIWTNLFEFPLFVTAAAAADRSPLCQPRRFSFSSTDMGPKTSHVSSVLSSLIRFTWFFFFWGRPDFERNLPPISPTPFPLRMN